MTRAKKIHVGKDYINRDQVNITNVYYMPAYQAPADLEALRSAYLEHLRRRYRALDFKGIPQLDSFARELLLEEVYVPLLARPERPEGETWARLWHAGRPLDGENLPEEALAHAGGASLPVQLEAALEKERRVVVLGDPGSGKSTLLKHLALSLAGMPSAPLPILAPLNAYAALLGNGRDCSLQAFLGGCFAGFGAGLEDLSPLFDSAISQGQALILLDGLDEVQSADRQRLIQRVEAFGAQAAGCGCRVVVTSRIVGYRESPLTARDWTLYTLLDFDRAAIGGFAGRWCRAFEKSTLGDTPEAQAAAERERVALLESVDANPGVARLACNPLLLTILALIRRQGASLPNRRVELYEVYLKTLIHAWNKARGLDKTPVGPDLDYLQTISVLGPLALWLREENPTAGLVPEERLVEWLTGYIQQEWGSRPKEAMQEARAFLDGVRSYSSLLLERGRGRYGFIHLTFEEALAARGLVQKGQLNLEESLGVIRRHVEDAGWRETILLAVGVWGLVREEPRKAGEVVRALLKMDCAAHNACQNVLLAGACLEDVGEIGMGRAAAGEVREALLAACRDRSLPPGVQRDAGFSLGRSGWAPPDLDAFVPIPAGEFFYGDKKEKAVIPRAFEIARYPVTNRQYRLFVEDGGYDNRGWWSAAGWDWRTGRRDSQADPDLKRWLDNRLVSRRGEPFFWHDMKWNNPLAPVVGVCWFEAEAFCAWLSARLGRPIRLPDEQCWERAARGLDGREYPWGNAFDRTRLNCADFWAEEDLPDVAQWNNWIESESFKSAGTTIVGQFPEGSTTEGLNDMAGNTWEWTASAYDSNNMVLRGGAWGNDRRLAGCACRFRYVPDGFLSLVGFRVISPGSGGSAC